MPSLIKKISFAFSKAPSREREREIEFSKILLPPARHLEGCALESVKQADSQPISQAGRQAGSQ